MANPATEGPPTSDETVSAAVVHEPRRKGWFERVLDLRFKLPLVPIIILLVFLVIPAIFAPFLAPHGPFDGGLSIRLLPPVWLEGGSWDHILGTDRVGRDIFSRIIYGSRISIGVSVVAIFFGGLIARLGKRADCEVAQRLRFSPVPGDLEEQRVNAFPAGEDFLELPVVESRSPVGRDEFLELGEDELADHAREQARGGFAEFALLVFGGEGDGLAFGPDGDLYVAGQDNNAVLRYDGKTGKSRGAFVKPGAGGLDGIRGIAFHPDGDLLVAGRENNSILRFTAKTGIPKVDFVSESGGKLDHPIQLRYGPDGYLYVSSGKNSRIMRYDGKTGRLIGTFVKHKSGGLDHPSGFDWGAEGDLYVASRDSHQILRYDGKTGAFKAVVLDRKDEKQMKSPEFLLMIN